MTNKITTKTKRKKKPHKKFKAVIQFDSTPTELIIDAESTETTIKTIAKNPYKFSFGKVRFPHGVAEACIYINKKEPQKMPNSVIWFFKKDNFSKGSGFVCDKRRIKEFINLKMKTYYFLSLTVKQRLKYLRNKGVFANININRISND